MKSLGCDSLLVDTTRTLIKTNEIADDCGKVQESRNLALVPELHNLGKVSQALLGLITSWLSAFEIWALPLQTSVAGGR